MIGPEIPFEGDAVETLLALANSFLPSLDLPRLSVEILSNVVYVESAHQFIITVKQLVSLVLLRRRI